MTWCISCKTTRAYFNYKEKTKAEYCFKCKLNDMVNIIHKKCIKCNLKHPVFNYEGESKATHCSDCMLDDML